MVCLATPPPPRSGHAPLSRQKLAWRRVILIGRRGPRPATPSRSKPRPLARGQGEASLAAGREAVPRGGTALSEPSDASSQSEEPVGEASVSLAAVFCSSESEDSCCVVSAPGGRSSCGLRPKGGGVSTGAGLGEPPRGRARGRRRDPPAAAAATGVPRGSPWVSAVPQGPSRAGASSWDGGSRGEGTGRPPLRPAPPLPPIAPSHPTSRTSPRRCRGARCGSGHPAAPSSCSGIQPSPGAAGTGGRTGGRLVGGQPSGPRTELTLLGGSGGTGGRRGGGVGGRPCSSLGGPRKRQPGGRAGSGGVGEPALGGSCGVCGEREWGELEGRKTVVKGLTAPQTHPPNTLCDSHNGPNHQLPPQAPSKPL